MLDWKFQCKQSGCWSPKEVFTDLHTEFTDLQRKLCEIGSFSVNGVDAGHPRQYDLDQEDDVLEHFRRNP